MRALRSAKDIKAASAAQQEGLALRLGRSVKKIISSHRLIFATRKRLGLPPLGKAR
jgi:hypothetical protein